MLLGRRLCRVRFLCHTLVLKYRNLRQSSKNWIRHAYLRKITNEAFTNPKRFLSYFKFKNKKSPIPVPTCYNQGRSQTQNLGGPSVFSEVDFLQFYGNSQVTHFTEISVKLDTHFIPFHSLLVLNQYVE